jgi:hypothetical protein
MQVMYIIQSSSKIYLTPYLVPITMLAGFSPGCDILLICWGNSAKLLLSKNEKTYTMASALSLQAWKRKKNYITRSSGKN